MEKIIAQGAEAHIIKSQDTIIKRRIKKSYRFPDLDEKIRTSRTKKEAKILEKASKLIFVPKLINVSEKATEIEMENIKGKKLSQYLDILDNKIEIAKKIGKQIACLHDNNVTHGDLTTSNMILGENKEVYFIDFGLSFISQRIEDKAVDLHLIKEALESKHFKYHKKIFEKILEGYSSSKMYEQTIKQLEKVESRGRYKMLY